VDKLLIRR